VQAVDARERWGDGQVHRAKFWWPYTRRYAPAKWSFRIAYSLSE
jgi:hypothetical protein